MTVVKVEFKICKFVIYGVDHGAKMFRCISLLICVSEILCCQINTFRFNLHICIGICASLTIDLKWPRASFSR